ncbi:unnamed protein product [Paramecium pentaurelia]|uniref:Major facilitator superfamily (MFS) profile domain-containing protein n=1 Tax=Paramecium pentaurelia TaxID=43138 RepID=A0A8S1X150_9CILI|nr:unnamed protein product [Paramecium pentaurelia]
MSIIAPFYPQFAKSKDISEDIIGIIFAAHPLGQFISSLILGKLITHDNRQKIMIIGISLQGLGLLLFGFLYYFDSYFVVLIGSFMARLIGGIGASMFMTPFYAFIPQLFPKSIEEKIAIAEVSTSLGFLGGPILGSALYQLGGFILPFFFFAGCSFGLAVILIIYSKSLDVPDVDLSQSIILHQSIQNQESIIDAEFRISYLKLLCNYPVVISFITNTLTLSLWTFYNPTIAIYLLEQYDIQEEYSGYWISINAASFGFSTLFISRIKSHKKFYMYFGLVISGFLQFYMGPDYKFTNLNPRLLYTILSWSLVGFTAGFPYVLTLPQINQILTKDYYKYPTQCANIASAIFNASLAGGELFGPILGGYLTKWYGFQRSASLLGFAVLICCVLYIPYLFYLDEKLARIKAKKLKRVGLKE